MPITRKALIAGGETGDHPAEDQQPQAVQIERDDGQHIASEGAGQAHQQRILASDRIRQLGDVDHAQEPGEKEAPDHQPVIDVANSIRRALRQEVAARLHDQTVDDGKD
jgi:hypothetical protein